MSGQTIVNVIEKNYKLTVKVVDSKKHVIKNVSIKIFRNEKDPISPEQYAENIKNGAAFKRLILTANTNNEGLVTAELAPCTYEVKLEAYGLKEICQLDQNKEILFIEPKTHWWQ